MVRTSITTCLLACWNQIVFCNSNTSMLHPLALPKKWSLDVTLPTSPRFECKQTKVHFALSLTMRGRKIHSLYTWAKRHLGKGLWDSLHIWQPYGGGRTWAPCGNVLLAPHDPCLMEEGTARRVPEWGPWQSSSSLAPSTNWVDKHMNNESTNIPQDTVIYLCCCCQPFY